MKRGRRLGQKVNPRDQRGWMIPRSGTIRRKVYDMMLQRKQIGQIASALKISYAACIMHRQHIMKSDRKNRQRYAAEHPEQIANDN